jgi:hypothetical protein
MRSRYICRMSLLLEARIEDFNALEDHNTVGNRYTRSIAIRNIGAFHEFELNHVLMVLEVTLTGTYKDSLFRPSDQVFIVDHILSRLHLSRRPDKLRLI